MKKLSIIGNVTRDVELRTVNIGSEERSVTDLIVAVNGRKEEPALFIKVVLWGKAAENAAQYLSKGKKVAVIGNLSVDEYTDKEGGARYQLCIKDGAEVEYLSPKADTVPEP